MGDLSARDAHAVLDAVRDVLDADDLDEFATVVLQTVHRLVPSDGVGYNEVDPRVPRMVAQTDPLDYVPDWFADKWVELAHEHPIYSYMQRTGDASTRTISDFLTHDQFKELELYWGLYHLAGIEYQIAFGLPAPQPLVVAVAATREAKDFSRRDRRVLETFRPHLMQAYRVVRTRSDLRTDLDTVVSSFARAGRHVAFVERGNLRAPGDGEAVLDEWIDDRDTFDAWLRSQQRHLAGDELPDPSQPLVLLRGSRRAVIRYVAGAGPTDALLIDVRDARIAPERLRTVGLTTREAEVLALLADGEEPAAVAAILGVQPGTVRKHLERIYRKLGTTSRAQAVAAAFEVLADT
jgi:DNA-binding CsgD family transcriptional regulator